MWATEAFKRVLEYPGLETVLDIGCGRGEHAEAFRAAGKQVTTLDANRDYKPDIVANFAEWNSEDRLFDIVWASHVLEHQRNVGRFLDKCHRIMSSRGIFVVTVPPAKHNIVGGHLTLWNQGLLVYNLVVSGFNCSHARVSPLYGYNISVIVGNEWRLPIRLLDDAGDIETLAQYFPFPVKQDFDGSQVSVGW